MAAPSLVQLNWALAAMSEWRARLGEPAFRKRLATYTVLRRLGATTTNGVVLDGPGMTAAVRELFGIAETDEELVITKGRHFFNPFSGEYMRETWPTGTMLTRLDTGSYEEWVVVRKEGQQKSYRLRGDHLSKLAAKIGDNRVPAVAIGVFFFRRPSTLNIPETSLINAQSYSTKTKELLKLTDAEFSGLFDSSPTGFPAE